MKIKKKYYPSLDVLRIICVVLLVISTFGLPFSFFSLISPAFNFGPCVLFAVYGVLVYSHEEVDYAKYIKRLAIAFGIIFVIYLGITVLYQRLTTGSAVALFTKRTAFEFLVLNVWPLEIGSSIWMIQSTLYAMIVLAVLDRTGLLKYDWIICIVLFVIAILLGEGAAILRYNFVGYRVIPGNFFTRAIPYMLLGRIFYRTRRKVKRIFYSKREKRAIWWILLAVSFVLCYVEIFALSFTGKLAYYTHLIGYIPLTYSILAISVMRRQRKANPAVDFTRRRTAFVMYCVYSPLGYGLVILGYLVGSGFILSFVGVLTLIAAAAIGVGYALYMQNKEYKAGLYIKPDKNKGVVQDLDEPEDEDMDISDIVDEFMEDDGYETEV